MDIKVVFWLTTLPFVDFSFAQKCLEMLQLVVDKETDPEKAAYMLKKIKSCKMCTDCYEQNNCLKDILHNKIERKSVPQDVIDCIKMKLKEEGH